jgi:hypothetical protein
MGGFFITSHPPFPEGWRDENPCEAPGSNAGASFASHPSIRAAHLGMANGNPASPTMKNRNSPLAV